MKFSTICIVMLCLAKTVSAQLYYGIDKTVVITSADGSQNSSIDANYIDGITVDTVNNYIYWSQEVFNSTIKRAKPDGSDMTVVATGSLNSYRGLDIDYKNKKLYIADLANDGKIFRCDLDGSNYENLVAGKPDGVTNGILDIAVDPENGKMYWITFGAVMRADLDGSNIEKIADFASYIQPQSIDLDVRDGYVYWVDTSHSAIKRIPLDGGTDESIINDSKAEWISVNMKEEKIYWLDQTFEGKIYRADLDGSNSEKILDIGYARGGLFAEGFKATTTPISKTVKSNPEKLRLDPNYPNPFNPTTSIHYELPEAGLASLTVYDILGHKVAVLANGKHAAGTYNVHFNASQLSSGVYFYRLQTPNRTLTKKMMLIK